ncbi:MAG: DUF4962 domain-containing protein [Cytophagales bacterium]|nr:DUF4962 domain-containing protein [Cytophagales bacterium]
MVVKSGVAYSKLLVLVLILSVFYHCEEIDAQSRNYNIAEKSIDKKSIHPIMRLDPFPQSGKIEVNSPWMLWSPVVKSKTGYNTYKFDENYLYKGRVSKDPQFEDETTIISEPREWTFFSPYKKLETGTWYWQYASIDKNTGSEKWSEAYYFEVTGRERDFVVPAFDKILKNIPKSHPRTLAYKHQIGKLTFPEELTTEFIAKMSQSIGEEFPASLLYGDETVLAEKRNSLSDVDLTRFIAKRTKEIYREHKFSLESMLKAYIITGDEKYAKESIRRYNYLKDQYFKIIDAGAYNDFTEGFYFNVLSGIYDVCYDYLEPKEREYIKEILIESQEKTYHHFLHVAEHYILNSHMWQFHLRTFLGTSLALLHDVPEAEKWVKFVYEVWTMRAPVGSKNDGGWFTGNGYMDANKGSLLIMPVILSRMTGVNYFEHPWYRNVGEYLAYTSPVGHISGSYGDNADVKRENLMDFVIAYTHITGNPYGKNYIDLGESLGPPQDRGIRKPTDEESRLPISLDENGSMIWYMHLPLPAQTKKQDAEYTRAKSFPDVGTVAAHTNLMKPEKNLMFSFRASPFGVVGHSQASQNSFNIQYGGEPLFFRTGYYSSYADHHSLQSYKHTRAHNSVLAGGVGQAFTPEGYGWIARFATGRKITYALGDASNAYNDTKRDQLDKMFKKWKVAHTPENGFGEPGVTRFRRHAAMLDDNIVIIYDELEAEQPITWSWLIHSRDTLALQGSAVYTENSKGKGLLNLYGGEDNPEMRITDQFHAPAVDWLGNGWKRGIEYVNHWHGDATTKKMRKVRFLAIIQVTGKEKTFTKIEELGDGRFAVNGWQIKAGLDSNKPAKLLCQKDEVGAIGFNVNKIKLGGKTVKPEIKGSTILIEKKGDDWVKQEVIDRLPDGAIYY